MTVLFCALHFGYFRNFESAICSLAERGHRVRVLAEEPERFGGLELIGRLAATYANVSWAWAPHREGEAWVPVLRKLRYGLEYVRFLDALAGQPGTALAYHYPFYLKFLAEVAWVSSPKIFDFLAKVASH